MFYNNKYFILSIILTCLSILHHNNATIYSGWIISITDNGVKQLHYMFETNAKEDNSVFVRFNCGHLHMMVPGGGGFPNLSDVEDLLNLSLRRSSMFAAMKYLLPNLRITVFSRIPLMNYNMEAYVQSFIKKVRDYFQVRSGITKIITHEIRTGPIVEATMLYFSINFLLSTNTYIPINIIKSSSGGMSIIFRSTLDRFKQLSDVTAKHYYVKHGWGTSRDILFATRAYCSKMKNLIRASLLSFISNSKKKLDQGNALVSTYPCFNADPIFFDLHKTDKNNICLQDFISVELPNLTYMITANFNFEACVLHLREILGRPKICEKFDLCWLNLNTNIFAEPTDKHFYLIGDMYNQAYSLKRYNIFELEESIRHLVYYSYHRSINDATAKLHIRAMYVLTFCQMLVESIGVNSKDITFQASLIKQDLEVVLLDARLKELLPVLQATPFD